MTKGITRRGLMTGVAAVSAAALSGCKKETYLPPHLGDIIDASDTLTMSVQRYLMGAQSSAPEYSADAISKQFPVEGTALPDDALYQRWMDQGFLPYRLSIDGLVDRPLSLSVADLKQMPSRSQITSHNCESGWSAIAKWQGVKLADLLAAAGMQREARYVCFECVDGWYDFIDMFDALHEQTIMAYGMNDKDLPVPHGAPVRLRVERHVGYKSLKFVTRISVVDKPERVPSLGYGRIHDFAWYGGA